MENLLQAYRLFDRDKFVIDVDVIEHRAMQ